jgi:hypothetical protein
MIKTITATVLSAVMAATTIVPAGAMSVVPAGTMSAVGGTSSSPIEKVQILTPEQERERDAVQRGDRNYQPRDWVERDYDRDRRVHRWNGHRGYRDYRPGYRRHSDGWWYPLAAFGLGAAIIGGLAAQQPPRVGAPMPVSHVRWCQGRYRSYDAYTNTFQPYNGPRQVCVSPYYR